MRAASIADVDRSCGQFDYIICHGVYSWVPPAVQDKILWICRASADAQGVAYVSYNTYPGWHLRTVVRELMNYHTARFDDPQTKVTRRDRSWSSWQQASASLESPMSRMLAEEAESLLKAPTIISFTSTWRTRISRSISTSSSQKRRAEDWSTWGGLAPHQIDNLPAGGARDAASDLSDLIDLEQFVDLIRSRTFRRTLLAHQGAGFVQTPDPEVVESLYFTAWLAHSRPSPMS